MALDSENLDDIINLGVIYSNLNLTLRKMIMDIKGLKMNTSNIFHAVNLSWKGDRVSFSFLLS